MRHLVARPFLGVLEIEQWGEAAWCDNGQVGVGGTMGTAGRGGSVSQ